MTKSLERKTKTIDKELDPYRLLCQEVAKRLQELCETENINCSPWSIKRLVDEQIGGLVGKMQSNWLENNREEQICGSYNHDKEISYSDDQEEQNDGSEYNDEILRKYAWNEVSYDLYKHHLGTLVHEMFEKIKRKEQMQPKVGKLKKAIVKDPLIDAYEKYYAVGKVIINAKTPREYVSMVEGLLRRGGVITIVLKWEYEGFYNELLAKGVPLEDARAIVRSLSVLEDGAYLVAKENYRNPY